MYVAQLTGQSVSASYNMRLFIEHLQYCACRERRDPIHSSLCCAALWLYCPHRHVFFSSAKPRVPTDPAHHAPHDNNQTAQDLTKLKDGPLIAQDIDTPDPPATESFRVGSGHDQSPNRSHSHSSHAGPVAESDEGTHSGSDDGLQSAAHSEAGMDAEQGKVVPIGHGGRMEVAGAAPDRASQRTSAGASTSRSSPLLTARIVAGIPLGHAAKQGSDTPTNNVNTNTNAHTLDSPDNGAQGHTNAATTGTDTQGHSPHMGTGLMWSEYRVFQMPSWLRRHVLFNWLAIVAYMVAFALGVVWLRKGPDVQCPRGLLVAWGVLSLVILAQIIIQVRFVCLSAHGTHIGPCTACMHIEVNITLGLATITSISLRALVLNLPPYDHTTVRTAWCDIATCVCFALCAVACRRLPRCLACTSASPVLSLAPASTSGWVDWSC